MRLCHLKCIIVFLFFIQTCSIYAYADSGNYVLQPYDSHMNYDYSSGDQKRESFLELPLLIKIFAIIDAFLVLIAMRFAVPYISGRVKNVLENNYRQIILGYVQSNPGCTMSEVSTKQKINLGTVRYHLDRLESAGKITFLKMGKFSRVFYNSSSIKDKEKVISSYLRNETSRQILLTILNNPGITNQSLTEKMQVDKSAITWHLQKFINDNVVIYERDGKFKKYSINKKAEKILIYLSSKVPLQHEGIHAGGEVT